MAIIDFGYIIGSLQTMEALTAEADEQHDQDRLYLLYEATAESLIQAAKVIKQVASEQREARIREIIRQTDLKHRFG